MKTSFAAPPARLGATLVFAMASLAGCSTIEGWFGGDKTDYRNTQARQRPLEVPPDLTQLARESRYQPQGGVVSASAAGSAPAGGGYGGPMAGLAVVAPSSMGGLRIEREGQQRWLAVPLPPEQVWPVVRNFWAQRGYNVVVDNAQTGVMETDWFENRTKLPTDFVRNTLGRLLGGLYDTGQRDRFRTRIERSPNGGSEIYVSHRGAEEVFTDARHENTAWRTRPNDPQLEAEMLAGLMTTLAGRDEAVRTAAAAASGASSAARGPLAVVDLPAKASLQTGSGASSLVVDEPYDRAWRRVGLALDRGGFTVEDRDRAAGLYFVRYVDPKYAGTDEPGWWSRLFSGSSNPQAALRYRIALKPAGDKTTVSVQNSTGAADSGENAQRIVGLLVNELR